MITCLTWWNILGSSKRRIIDQLRHLYPGRWTYSHAENSWTHEDGWSVEPRCAIAPRFDGDDDGFETRYYRTDTYERIYVCRSARFSRSKGCT